MKQAPAAAAEIPAEECQSGCSYCGVRRRAGERARNGRWVGWFGLMGITRTLDVDRGMG
jgi:hypothetical protein